MDEQNRLRDPVAPENLSSLIDKMKQLSSNFLIENIRKNNLQKNLEGFYIAGMN